MGRRPAREDAPARTCAGCRARRPATELVRFAVGESGRLAADVGRRRVPGRGVWLCPAPACAEHAARRGGIQRTLRRGDVGVSPEALRALLDGALVAEAARTVRGAVRAGALDPGVAAALLGSAAAARHEMAPALADIAESLACGARGVGTSGAPTSPPGGMTHSDWSARILRRFERLGAYRAAERELEGSTASRGRTRPGRRQDVSGC